MWPNIAFCRGGGQICIAGKAATWKVRVSDQRATWALSVSVSRSRCHLHPNTTSPDERLCLFCHMLCTSGCLADVCCTDVRWSELCHALPKTALRESWSWDISCWYFAIFFPMDVRVAYIEFAVSFSVSLAFHMWDVSHISDLWKTFVTPPSLSFLDRLFLGRRDGNILRWVAIGIGLGDWPLEPIPSMCLSILPLLCLVCVIVIWDVLWIVWNI
jgi:hypothetical protein